MKKIVLTVSLTALIVLSIGGINSFLQNRPYVPEAFTASRAQAAKTGEKINSLIQESLESLKEIESLDRRFAFAQALLLVADELGKNPDRASVAIELAKEMEKMAVAVDSIRPEQARQIAFEAVSAQIAAITRLAAYNQTLSDLFETLRQKFEGLQTNPAKVEQLVKDMNAHAKEINKLNEKFSSLLEDFDAFYSK